MASLLARLVDLIPFIGNKLGPYRKLVVAVAGIVVAVVVHYVGTEDEWVTLGIAVLSALGLYEVPNAPVND